MCWGSSSCRSPNDIAENAARFGPTAFGWLRADLAPNQGFGYWRDVHGHSLRATRVVAVSAAASRARHGRSAGGDPRVDLRCPADEQPHGSAELLVLAAADQALSAGSPFVTPSMTSEISCSATSHTELPMATATRSSTRRSVRCHRGRRPIPVEWSASSGAWRSRRRPPRLLAGRTGTGMVSVPVVKRLRLVLLEPYDELAWQSHGVLHDWAPERQYHAWLDAVASDDAAFGALVTAAGAQRSRSRVACDPPSMSDTR
jgi:hypothetical protein